MKLKKFSVRGLIALAVTFALCMFFANTVDTITSRRCRGAGRPGKLEHKISLARRSISPRLRITP
jgi:hypothetical protein